MKELIGSRVKVSILLYLGLRGGSTGRQLATVLKLHPTPVFKALNQLLQGKVVRNDSGIYELNPLYRFHPELLAMLFKEAEDHPKTVSTFLPPIKKERQVDPLSIYRLIELRPSQPNKSKLSDVLRERYD